MAAKGVLVGVDVGTTAVKVVAHDRQGRELAARSERYGLSTPKPGYAEQDAEEIYGATMRSLGGVVDEIKAHGEQPLAIGFSSAMHGVLAVDEGGEPISPLIIWMDRRSVSIAERWHDDGTAARLYARTGAPMHPMLPLCKLRWLAENDAALFRRAHRFVGMKELLVHRWTGEWLIDHGIASATGMMDAHTRTWDAQALSAAGVPPERLSELAPCSTCRTIQRPQVAAALGLDSRTSIVLASSDGALANLGTGAVSKDLAALTLGTSGAVRIVNDVPSLDAQGRTFCYAFDDSRWIVGGPTSSAGAVLEWLFALLLDDVPAQERFGRAVALAEQVRPGAGGLTFLPFLSGERAPYWRGDLRGGLAGLDLVHDARDILRAAFEGVVFALYSVYRVMRELGARPSAVALSGGLSHAPLVRRMIADIFEIEAWLPEGPEASAFGAAMFAGVATGVLRSLSDVTPLVRYPSKLTPQGANQEAYRAAYQRFEERVEREIRALRNGSSPV
jgi:gluconokinase